MGISLYGAHETAFIFFLSIPAKSENHHIWTPDVDDTQMKYLVWLTLSIWYCTTTILPSHCIVVLKMVTFKKMFKVKGQILSDKTPSFAEYGHFVNFGQWCVFFHHKNIHVKTPWHLSVWCHLICHAICINYSGKKCRVVWWIFLLWNGKCQMAIFHAFSTSKVNFWGSGRGLDANILWKWWPVDVSCPYLHQQPC